MRRQFCDLLNPALRICKLKIQPISRRQQALERAGNTIFETPDSFGMVVSSDYGPVVVLKHDINQTNALRLTGKACNHNDIMMLNDIIRRLPTGGCVLDIGANFGLYALNFAQIVQDTGGVVHAFEAQRIIAAMVGGTTVLNGLTNLHVHHKAVGNSTDPIEIPAFDYNQRMNFGSIEFGAEQKEKLSQERAKVDNPEFVQQIRIDDQGFRDVRLIKIDIEGMEEEAIRGAEKTISRDKPVWLKSDKAKLTAQIEALGYKIKEWGGDLLCIHVDDVLMTRFIDELTPSA